MLETLERIVARAEPPEREQMEPTSSPLDQIAELLQQWQGVEGPVERVRVITDATQALRGLSSVDTRVLAQGLWEHGAPAAAEQVATRTGTSVSADDAAEAAQAMLSLDRGEVRRLVEELGDTGQRRQLLINSGVPIEEVERLVPDRVAAETDQAGAGAEHGSPAPDQGVPPPPGATDASPAPSVAEEVVEPSPSPAQAAAGTLAVDRSAAGPAPIYGGGWDRRSAADVDQLMEALRSATSGRERLQRLDEADRSGSISGVDLERLLRAVPDGWQRRTILRKLVKAGRLGEVAEPAGIVTAFDRPGDRFAAAAMLVRAHVAETVAVATALGPGDAARLARRVRG